MRILVVGAGALGSNLVACLVPDLRSKHSLSVCDKDSVEERNISAGTQHFVEENIGTTKVSALELNIYREYGLEIQTIHKDITKVDYGAMIKYDLLIDACDNYIAREHLQSWWISTGREVLHIGFSQQFTWALEWASGNYKTPTDIKGLDICEMQGAGSFVKHVASLASLVVQEFLTDGKKRDFIGNKFTIREVGKVVPPKPSGGGGVTALRNRLVQQRTRSAPRIELLDPVPGDYYVNLSICPPDLPDDIVNSSID